MSMSTEIAVLDARVRRLTKMLSEVKKGKSFKGRGKIVRAIVKERNEALKKLDKLER